VSGLIEKIDKNLKESMLKKDAVSVSTLRMLKSAVKNLEITKSNKASDADINSVIQKQIKQRKDSVEQYKKGGRQDLVQSEEAEIKVLETYLPKQMSDDELSGILKQILNDNNLSSKKEFGKAMKLVQEKVKGQADNKRISALLNQILTQ
jgi:uncharacterized protein